MTGVAANSAASVLGRAFRAALLIPYVAAAVEALASLPSQSSSGW